MIGEMRDSVTFAVRQALTGGDGYGNVEEGFADQFTVAARIEFAKGGETILAQRVQGVQPVTIRVRASDDTRLIDAGWRAQDARSGRTYNVRSVTPDAWRRWIDLVCEAGVAEG